jgi:beta-mannanase
MVYRHLHDLFVAEGAANVLWVFCPNFESVPSAAWNQWASYYPGDAYVDWMGFDGYNRGTSEAGSTWRTFTQVAGTLYAGLAAKGKPIMIGETASTEVGGDKAAWIRAVLPALRGSYPAVKALVWFHMNKSTDWRVDSSATARTAFVAMANDPYFNP